MAYGRKRRRKSVWQGARKRRKQASTDRRFAGISRAIHPASRVREAANAWRTLTNAHSALLQPSSIAGRPLRVPGDASTGLALGGGSENWNANYQDRVVATSGRATVISALFAQNYFEPGTGVDPAADHNVRLECGVPHIYEPMLNLNQRTTWEDAGGSVRIGGRMSRKLFDVKGSFRCRIQLHPGNPSSGNQNPDGSNGWVANGLNGQGRIYTDPQYVRIIGIEVYDMGNGTGNEPVVQDQDNPSFTTEQNGDEFGIENTPRYWITAPTPADIFEGYAHPVYSGELPYTGYDAVAGFDPDYGEVMPLRTTPAPILSGPGIQGMLKNERLLTYKIKKGEGEVANPLAAQNDIDADQRRRFKVFHDQAIRFMPPAMAASGTVREGGARIWEGRLAFNIGREETVQAAEYDKIEGSNKRVFYYFFPTVSNSLNSRWTTERAVGAEHEWPYTDDGTVFPGAGHHHFTVSLTDERSEIKNWNPLGLAV